MDDFCSFTGRRGKNAPAEVVFLGYPRDFTEHFEFTGKVLGKGGFGTVHLIKKKSTNESFACKEIRKALDPSISTVAKLKRHLDNIQREVAVLKKLKGSLNIVNLEAVFENETSVFVVTECCFGGELIHTIGLRPYSEQTVARIMKAVLRTLAQCHERGILHRDVKPGNFMFLKDEPQSPIKAIDFGLAVFFEVEIPRTDLGFDGTPWFMAPEVLSSQVVPASDVWSAGVMAFQLLTGRLPFDDLKNPNAPALSLVWRSILTDEPNFNRSCWKEITQEGKDFVKMLLDKEPTRRPTAVEALSHNWIQKFSKSRESTQLPHTIVQRIQRFGQSNLFKRTVLDMIANELLQSYVEKTKYNEKKFMKTYRSIEDSSNRNPSGNSVHAQSNAIEILKGMNMRRRWNSMMDLAGGSPKSIEEMDVESKKASRLALDTSHHGSEGYGSIVESLPFGTSPQTSDVSAGEFPGFDVFGRSPNVGSIPLQSTMEKESFPLRRLDQEKGSRGRSLYKEYLESQGQSLDTIIDEKEEASDPKRQRVEQFMKSVFGVEDSAQAGKVMEFLNFSLSTNVSENELIDGFAKLGYKIEPNEIPVLVEILAPGQNEVNFTQFVASQIDWEHLRETHKDTWLECVKNAFESMDKDQDGALSIEDIMSSIREKLPNSCEIDAAVEQACAEVCVSEKMHLTFEDFVNVLKEDLSMQSLKNFDSRYNDHLI